MFKYAVQVPAKEWLLLYDPLTPELLLLSPEESNELIAKWFSVRRKQDDMKIPDRLRATDAFGARRNREDKNAKESCNTSRKRRKSPGMPRKKVKISHQLLMPNLLESKAI